jgi:type IX secretion system substrate protein
MKQIALLTLGFFLICEQSFAQITLNMSGYPTSFSGADSIKATIGNTGIPSLIPDINTMWDFSGVTYSGSNYLTQFTGVPTPETFGTPLSMGSGITSYQSINFNKISSTGYTVDADSISYQYISLTPLTAGAYDSLIFPNQINYYSSPETVIPFPATMGTAWSNNISYADNFFLTVGTPSLSHAAGQFKYTFTETDTVVGWGQMRVKNIDGTHSGYMEVLQVKRILNRVDSFFLNGSPASSILLTLLGVTQGQSHSYFQYRFYRANEVTPLVSVIYSSNSFTTPDSAYIHTQRLASTASVGSINMSDKFRIYPNPVNENTVSIDVPDIQDANWSYDLINISGQNVASEMLPLNAHQTHATIVFPWKLVSGIYYLCLKNNNLMVSMKRLEINSK